MKSVADMTQAGIVSAASVGQEVTMPMPQTLAQRTVDIPISWPHLRDLHLCGVFNPEDAMPGTLAEAIEFNRNTPPHMIPETIKMIKALVTCHGDADPEVCRLKSLVVQQIALSPSHLQADFRAAMYETTYTKPEVEH